MNQFFDSRARDQLHQWFSSHSRNPRMEIEARVKDVTQEGFDEVMAYLKKNKGWSNTPVEHETIDKMHRTGVRETVDVAAKQRSYMRKNRGDEPMLVPCSAAHAVRFAVSSEIDCQPDDTPVTTWRRKRRVSFVHKGMFAFELTRVNQGPNEQMAFTSPIQYEIELEFCGQKLGDRMPNAAYLTDSMLMKVRAARPRAAALCPTHTCCITRGPSPPVSSTGPPLLYHRLPPLYHALALLG